MEHFDAIVIGGGNAGRSSAACLILEGRSVALPEKQDKARGFASSFETRGRRFDIGIEGARELAPDSFLPSFSRRWGLGLPTAARRETMRIRADRGSCTMRGDPAREDLRATFIAEDGGDLVALQFKAGA